MNTTIIWINDNDDKFSAFYKGHFLVVEKIKKQWVSTIDGIICVSCENCDDAKSLTISKVNNIEIKGF